LEKNHCNEVFIDAKHFYGCTLTVELEGEVRERKKEGERIKEDETERVMEHARQAREAEKRREEGDERYRTNNSKIQ